MVNIFIERNYSIIIMRGIQQINLHELHQKISDFDSHILVEARIADYEFVSYSFHFIIPLEIMKEGTVTLDSSFEFGLYESIMHVKVIEKGNKFEPQHILEEAKYSFDPFTFEKYLKRYIEEQMSIFGTSKMAYPLPIVVDMYNEVLEIGKKKDPDPEWFVRAMKILES